MTCLSAWLSRQNRPLLLPRALPSTLRAIALTLLLGAASLLHAAVIRGTVKDTSGAPVKGASVVLVTQGKILTSTLSGSDGSYQFVTAQSGRFFLLISAPTFRQLETPDFYAARADNLERDLVLEPAWVRQSIIVTDTGTPVPQAQTSASTNVLGPLDLALRYDLTGGLRLMPGAGSVQVGQLGAQTSLFIRGGNSDAQKVLVDGIDAGDLGGQFDFGPYSTTGIEHAEIYRGPDSNLYGADAGSGVVSMTTPHGTTPFPSLLFAGDVGNFRTFRDELQLAGSRNRLDYYSAYSWLQSSNAQPGDEFHVGTTAANFGWQPSATLQLRGTLHYGVSATGVPNAWDFYHLADDSKENDQDLFLSGALDNQTTLDWHNSLRYGATRRREQLVTWYPAGVCIPVGTCDEAVGTPGAGNYFGLPVTITGANGYSASGQALLHYSTANYATYPSQTQLVSNRDQLAFQSDYRFTPHLTGLLGFHYEDERGSEPGSTYYTPVERTNYDYLLGVHGDFKNRLFYTLGGSLERYSLFGTQTSPRAGLSWNALRPSSHIFSGTRILFNFGDGVREPKLTDQDDSLYNFLLVNGGASAIQQLRISKLAAPTTRAYEGGIEQSFLGEHLVFRANYFHNEFGKEIEYVGLDLIPELLPNLTAAQQQQLESFLANNFAYELTLNSQAFRAQGLEATLESGIGRSIFLRAGYTYLDAVIQRSFTNSDLALLGPIPTYNGIPVGPYSPLVGARPFRRPPNSGFLTATYSGKKLTGVFSSAFVSRSDDSTYLEGEDLNYGNSLLLPNRNLDHGYAKLDLGGSYQLNSWIGFYAQGENLLSNQHIAPIGYPSLPFTLRAGLRLQFGKESKN